MTQGFKSKILREESLLELIEEDAKDLQVQMKKQLTNLLQKVSQANYSQQTMPLEEIRKENVR